MSMIRKCCQLSCTLHGCYNRFHISLNIHMNKQTSKIVSQQTKETIQRLRAYDGVRNSHIWQAIPSNPSKHLHEPYQKFEIKIDV